MPRLKRISVRTAAVVGAACLLPLFARAENIHGAGATFPAPLYGAWSAKYQQLSGTRLIYDAVGSGEGLNHARHHDLDFGASDLPMTQQELAKYGLVQFPAVVGGVVPVINITGIAPGQLKLSGEVLANVYLGKIRRWDDSAIAALNPGITLPHAKITIVHRDDPSGTTLLWTDYLSHANADWQREVGKSSAPHWPVGVGGTLNEGVASCVQRTRFAIGYVEYIYARTHHLSDVALRNQSGSFVHAGRDSFRAASEASAWGPLETAEQLPIDPPGAASWPITGASFILLPTHAQSRERAHATVLFFDWALHKGDAVAQSLAYAPIPDSMLHQLPNVWRTLSDNAGQAVWP